MCIRDSYIGYTSAIAGGDSNLVFEYLENNYGADEDEEDVIEYPLGYFFSGDAEDERYVITAPEEQTHRQLAAQYPSCLLYTSTLPVIISAFPLSVSKE